MVTIKFKDLSDAVIFASGDVKKLLKLLLEKAGKTDKDDLKKIIELLEKIKLSTIRDVNFARIIIALYYYLLKSNNSTLKSATLAAIQKTDNNSVLKALREGDGKKLGTYLPDSFDNDVIDEITKLVTNVSDDSTKGQEENQKWKNRINDIFNKLFERAKKVTKWKINQGLIDKYVLLLNKRILKQERQDVNDANKAKIKELKEKLEFIQKQYGDELNDYEVLKTNYIKLLTENNDLQKDLKSAYQTGDKVLHKSFSKDNRIQKLQNAYNELLANLKKLKESQKGSRHTDITEFADITKLENSPVNNLLKEFFPESESNVINVDELIDGFNEMAEGQPKNSPEKKAANKINHLKIDPKFVDNLTNIVANGDPKLKKQITEKTITIDTVTNNRTGKKHYRILGKQPAGLFNYLTEDSKNNPIKDENDRPQDKKSILYPFDRDIHKKVLEFLKNKSYHIIVNE